MDEIRPGGLVVAITSHGTMDKKDETLRRELAQKGELIRAVRLPNQLLFRIFLSFASGKGSLLRMRCCLSGYTPIGRNIPIITVEKI